ncbi:hypothetical protein BVY02_00585 [bacterium J17]|nr:hypothetical protein BVY02_00585 [bacterium J17]
MGKKVTGESVASKAGKVLRDPNSDEAAKCAAGSTLAQSKHQEKVTSEHAASAAGKVLRDPAEPKEAKSAAGSALAQREK